MQNIKKFLRVFNDAKGFTLIELLVVIGILGVLAAALVATIDPFEQLNKAQDANIKNASVEFLNADIRYFTTHNAMPWFAVANGGVDCNSGTTTLSGVALSTFTNCIQTLVDEGELKAGFKTFNGLSKIFVTNPNPQPGSGPNDIITCFMPVSKSGQKDAAAKYDATGANGVGCKSTGGAVNCYWCAQ